MSEWLESLMSLWSEPDHWEASLSQFLQTHGYPRFQAILKNFQNLRTLSNFSEQAPRLLPSLLMAGPLEMATQHLHSFGEAFQQKTGQPFDFAQRHTPALVSLFGRSDFLVRRLFKYPEWSSQILTSAYLRQPKPLEFMLTELRAQLHQAGQLSVPAFKNALRRYKYLEYLRITIRDTAKLGSLTEVMEEISSLASACLELALEAAGPIAQGHKELIIASEPLPREQLPFFILGMGKLGGNELNYSSDIDPIFLFEVSETGETPEQTIWRMKSARTLIELMSESTEEGFVCRVDMRLRPGGEGGPLVHPIDIAEAYYAGRGQPWERQALIKARVVAGDLKTGYEWLRTLGYWVYSKYIDQNLVSGIEEIKKRIEKEHLKEHHLNIKLGVGGIREIEFFVQIFQLLYGGSHPILRTTNTLSAIERLMRSGHLEENEALFLRRAYLYLRQLENCIQMEEERQTHIVPGDTPRQQALARHMGYTDANLEKARAHFLTDLKDIMSRVRAMFGGLFNQDYVEIEAAIRNYTHFRNFPHDIKRLLENSARQFSVLIRQASEGSLNTRFQRLFEQIGAKLHYYEHLNEHPSSFVRLARIAETSDFLWNYLLNHLDLIKQLENRDLLPGRAIWEKQLSLLVQASQEDEERGLDILREFKHSATFLLGSAELEGLISYEQARQGLTDLAEVILQQAYRMAQQSMQKKFSLPGEFADLPLAILGMGKLGGRELTYQSDLDLVFIYPEVTLPEASPLGAQEYFIKLIQRLISTLSTFTRAGYAYKLDTRLRPSGNAGVLVTTLNNYLSYHQTSQPWEHQAMIKARIVGGTLTGDWVEPLREAMTASVYRWTPPDDLAQQIHHLRHRKETELSQESARKRNLKEGFGGLLDIEYLTQYLQLRQARLWPTLQTPQTLEALRAMAQAQIITQEEAETLIKGYTFLRQLESASRLLFDKSTSLIDFDKLNTAPLLQFFQRQGHIVNDLFEYYQQTTQAIRKIYWHLMGVSTSSSS